MVHKNGRLLNKGVTIYVALSQTAPYWKAIKDHR